MVRDRQHGPVIELNRISVKKQAAANSSANNGGKVVPATASSTGGCKPVFAQMVGKVHLLGPESLLLPHRIWKVKFVGESVDDCGGGYSESIAELCDELMQGHINLLIATPNGRDEAGTSRDCMLLNPTLK